MEKILKKVQAKTYCVNCNIEFEKVWLCKMKSVIGTRYALLCIECQKLIGIYSSTDLNELQTIPYSTIKDLRSRKQIRINLN